MSEPATRTALARLAADLEQLESQSQLRSLDHVEGVNLCSNDYLALARDPRLKAAVVEALQREAALASTGSRLLSGNDPIWEALEEEFAAFVGARAALFFSSGYAANLGLLSALLRPEDLVFSDSANHASLIDGIRLSRARKVIFPHLDLDFLEDRLADSRRERCEKFIVIESLFSREGDRAPLAEIAALAEKYGAALIVDEAHATGVLGPQGRGLVAEAGVRDAVLASVHTCGKALASAGAFVAGSDILKRFLVNRARTFIFSTALPPYMAHQIRAALKLAREADDRRERLFLLADALRSRLKELGLNTGRSDSQIVPVMLGNNDSALRAAETLRRAGFAIRAIRPPTVAPGTARLRISLNAGLSETDCERLIQALVGAMISPHAPSNRAKQRLA
ncbi:MAG TPA: 8-amino-7-oxononanoate synthase [Terriglobia bacterium]|nr:8-amino-7-oxononanoate synthase [Terriglobia bacterium]